MNPQCFVRKTTVVILNQFNIKKIKLTKIILEKIIKKNYKGKHCNNPRCLKIKKLKSEIFNQFNIKKNKIDKKI